MMRCVSLYFVALTMGWSWKTVLIVLIVLIVLYVLIVLERRGVGNRAQCAPYVFQKEV